MTPLQFDEMLGMSSNTVPTIENGVFIPSTVLALKLVKTLEVKFKDVFWLEN